MKTGKRILSLFLAVALLLSMPITAFAEGVLAIDMATLPTKLIYHEGDALEVTGGELRVYYSSGEQTIALTEDMVTGFDSSIVGTNSLMVTYEGSSCTFDVQILPKAASAIAVTTLPAKLTYLEGKDALDVTGGELTVSYADETPEKTVPLTAEMVTGFDNTAVGTQTLTVTYAEQTTTFDVEIQAKSLTSIAVSQMPTKTKYLVGEESLDLTGGQIKATYDNGTSEILDITAEMVSGYDGAAAGQQTLTITYGTKAVTYQVEVFATEVTSISVATKPTATKYLLNADALNVAGGEIKVNYYDGTTATIPMTEDMVTGFDNTVLGEQTLTVTCDGQVATYTVDICEKVSTISVSATPDVLKYLVNTDALDVTGGLLLVTYYDGTTGEIPMTADMINGYDNTALGIQTLTVTYEGCTATFDVEICENNAAEFLSGLGTSERPYIIKTKAHLNNVRNHLDAHYMMIADIEFTEADFAEGGGFYNAGKGWQPIGNSSAPFSGSFDGNGHTVTGLRINLTASGTVYAGLFGYVSNAELKDLGMVDSDIRAKSTNDTAYAGGIAGCASGTTITNCYNTGSVTATASSSSSSNCAYAGGIAGYASGTITNCYNTGSVTATPSSLRVFAGGIAGYAKSATITNCYNTGSVTDTASATVAYAGGIAGHASGATITGCYNTGSVTATASTSAYAGGIAGSAYDSTTITNCYNTGSVTATISSSSPYADAYAGGIAGQTYGTITITNCYNTGNVTATNSSSDAYAGGIAGKTDSATTITNCYNTGSVTATASSSSDYAGGIAGYAKSGTTITTCYYLNTNSKGVASGTDTATKCTIEQMKQQATFVGFDFDTIWTTGGDENYLLPRLQGLAMVEIHQYTAYVSNGDATCTEDGTKTAVCDYCSKTDTVTDAGSKIPYIPGDINGDDAVTDADAIHLLYHSLLPELYPVEIPCDYNGDGAVTDADAIYLLYHTLLPDLYPLN